MDVNVGGNNYRIEPFASVFTSFEVARELGQVLAGLAMMKKADPETKMAASQYAQAICALSADVNRSDVDRATELCLASVSREQAGGAAYMPIVAPGTRRMMFADIDLMTMLELVWRVLEVNRLPDFFSAFPSALGEGQK